MPHAMKAMTVVTVIVACAVTFSVGIFDAPAVMVTLARFPSLPSATLVRFLSLPGLMFARFPAFPPISRLMFTRIAPAFGVSFVTARVLLVPANVTLMAADIPLIPTRALMPLRVALLPACVQAVLALGIVATAPMPFRMSSISIAALLCVPSTAVATLLRMAARAILRMTAPSLTALRRMAASLIIVVIRV